MNLQNPYDTPGSWLRGNLHTHTTESDGLREPQAVIDDYAERGYDFLAISDHDLVTDPLLYDSADLTLIRGNEVTANGPHVLHVNAGRRIDPHANRQMVLENIASDAGSLAVLPHPNWHRTYDHYPQELLEALSGHVGIEIYNGVIERLPGSAFALDRWDMLLGKGHRMWGFAHDDSHRVGDVELGWNVVLAEANTADAIVSALLRGAFYASTGVNLSNIQVDGAVVTVTAGEPVRWDVITDFGVRIGQAFGSSLRWELPPDSKRTYVRVEAHGAAGARAWTQPFFVSG